MIGRLSPGVTLRAAQEEATAIAVDLERITRARLVEGYGLTEAGPVTHANPLANTARHGFIGVPLPATKAKIVDMATDVELPAVEEAIRSCPTAALTLQDM